MKRFTSFLCSLLLAVFAMAQSETTTINVAPGDGNYNGTGWCSSWTSTSVDYPVAITVGVNNLNAATTSGGFQMARGLNADSDWTFSVAGYKVLSYSFKFKSAINNQDVTLSATNADGSAVSMTSSYSTEQTFSIDCSNASTATFRISGSNNSIIATDLTLTVRPAQALTSLEVGQVYRFINVLYPTYSLNANSATDVNAVTTNETDTKQQWYVEKQDGEYYVLRNLAYGKYLKGNGQSSAWSMSDDYSHNYNKFKLYTSNTDYNTLHTNTLLNYAYIHCNSSHNIVGWSNGTTDKGSHWEITKVDYTAEEITALLEKAPTVAEVAAYPAALGAIFSDAACTILNSAYTTTSMTDEQLAADANYSALPQTLKNMVKKVRNDEWSEATIAPASRPNGNNNNNHNLWTVEDTWEHEYAKKFRVQMYEPYSVEGEITSFLGINAHCNMDNPTGIYANAGEPIYIMVEGDIAEGAELWVAHQTGHGVTNSYNNAAYTQLKKGLNVIPYASDGCQLWINYLVHTYNTSTGEFPHKLSDYKPLKIHIEGGHINGFFNAMGDFRSTEVTGDANGGENLWGEVDNDADWDYYKARAALATDFALLGHRQTLLFPFGTWGEEVSYVDDKGNTTTYEAGFHVANDADSVEYALAWHLEHIEVPTTPNCYAGSGNAFGDFSDTYYPGMNLITNGTLNKINIMLEAWDRIMYSEHATMGLLSKSNIDKMNSLYPGWTAENTTFDIYNYGSNDTGDTYKAFCEGRDYSDYYNHHGAAVGSGTGYMSGGPRVCSYHYNTMGSIIGKIAVEAGPTWGPAHEIGHQHQAIFNLNGQTEVTNNFFSNVAVWYMGMGTSRVNGTEGSLASVLDAFNTEDNDLYTNNIWAITHLYYRLWLYYHLAGNNTQFWPRLFELLRQTPMVNGGQISGETSLLRFYQHACTAAGEDLTEFFRAHGFFELMTNRFVGDYSNATYNITEEQIETAITAVKENNYPVNYAVLLINDATSETTLKHDGTTKRALWDTKASAEYGSVNDFIEGNTSVTEAYTAIVGSDGTVTMSGGEGGVGFLVFNEDGELVSFSNKSTFELSDEAKETIMSGNATFVAVDSESNTTTAEVYLTAMQRTILAELIAMAQQIKDKIDDSYTKIGFYKAAAVADLAAALENAKTVYDAGTSGYGAAYDLLYAEYQKVLENPDARIPFDPSLTYIITNKGYTDQTMWVNDELTVRSESGVDQTADAAKWQFKATASDGVYNIYNKKGYYCPAVAQSTAMTATTTANADALYTLQEMETGVWAIKLSPAAGYRNFHSSWSNVVGWETGNDATRWYLTAVEPNATIADLTNLEVYITKTEALLGEVLGTVTYTKGENITLQTTTEGTAGYIWSNAPHSEGPIANLVDGVTTNYFHTDWQSGSNVTSGDHYIAVDLGEGTTLPRFAFSHTTRSGVQNDFPKSVDVYGSDDNVTYKYLGSALDMPQSAGTFWQFDGMIISSHRYLRFNVHANRGYWHMAEFDIMPVTSYTATVNDTYSGIVTVETVQSAMEAVYNGKGVTLSMLPTEDNINERLQALRSAYEALYTEYSAAITARKNTLAQLAAQTQEIIEIAGTVGLGSNVTKLTLTTENLYCNAPYMQAGSDYSAEYVTKLTDGSATTFLHTDYSGSVAAPHYLRVYLGENSAVKSFKFNYTTRNNGNDCPTTILIEGSNEADGTYNEIRTLTTADDLPNPDYGGVAESFESLVITMGAAYKYVRFMVTGVEGGNARFFVMSEFGFSTVEDVIAVNSKYKSVVTEELLLASVHTTNSSAAMSTNELVTSVPMLDAQIADQQAAYDKLNEAMQQATCDKTELQAAYDEALALYNKMADAEGNVTANYAPSTLTVEQLAAAKTALDAAKDKLDNSSEQDEIDAAKTAVDEKYTELLAIEEANVNREGSTFDKSELETLINNAATLLSTINGKTENNSDYYAAAGIAIDELQDAYNAAVAAKDRYYLTQEQYAAVKEALNDSYTTINPIVAADVAVRDELTTLIANVKTLLGTIAVESAPKNVAVPLQSTTADGDFYVSVAGTSSGSVAYLYDKNADGTAITAGDSYYGSNWEGVAEFSQYVQVDLGAGITIDKLLFDYTTRDSGHSNERPSAIKIYGSNNGTDYTEIAEINSGLATGQREQWSMAETLELGARYRYIRFNVNSTSQYHSFHMSDFNLYALIGHTLALKEYYTTATGLNFDALCIALQSAEYAANHYLTSDRLTEVKNMLSGYYAAANDIVEADVKDRTELAALATTTEELVTEVATFNTDEKVLGMQCTDETAPYYLYCNADGTTHTTYPNDAKGVAALLDDDATNHLHTTYEGATDDNLDHYLRLDMGENEAMMSFKFSYTGCSGNNNNAPKTMVIEGSNNLNDFEEIATLTNLPTTDATVTYTTPEALGNGKAYRYIRFMVTETRDNDKYQGHPFFVLSQFAVTACKTIEVSEDYVSPNLPLNTLVVANNETVDAKALVEEPTTYVSQSTYTNAITELQAAYDALNTAKMLKDLPVTLTTDVDNPVLYKIKVKSNSNVFKYDGEADSGTKNPVLAANETGDKYQAWYFMQGDNGNSYDDIVIMPYYHQGAKNTEYKLGYPNINGATEPLASVSGASSYNWYITFTSTGNNVTTEGWWNLQPENGTSDNTFLNQQGGSSSTTLSFWKSAANPNDNGSQFQFVLDETDYSKSDAYYELYNLHASCGGEKVSGEAIGCYTAGTVETYNNVYNAATEKLADADATDDDYNSARTALEDAYNALTRYMPVEGGFYKIRSAYKNAEGTEQYSYGGLVYVDDENAMMWAKNYDETSSRAIWYFTPVDGGYNISSLHTGAYAPSLGSGSQGVAADEAKKYTIEVLDDVTGVLKINSPGQPMHAQESGNKLVGWNDGLNSASAWYIEEVDVKTEIGQSITLNTAEGEDKSYSTFYSAYPVTLPDGVEASVVTARADNGQLSMTVITDEYNRVVPAYTAVVLSENKQDASDSSSSGWEVKFSDDVSPAEVAEDGNMLSGTLTTEYIDCTAPSTFVYSLGRKNNRVAMYKAYKNYEKVTADNGTVTYNKVGSSSNDGGYVKLGANKSYLKVEGQNNAAVAMFSFFFGGGTTDIDGINAVAEAYEAVYDLQGRKLEKVTEPGIYIVNGKKVYVSEVE